MILYFVVFGDIWCSLVKQLFTKGRENFLTERYLYVLCLAAALAPVVAQKRLAEIKIVSITLFVAVALFIILFVLQLCLLGNLENHDEDYGEYYDVEISMELVTAFNILVTAYAF